MIFIVIYSPFGREIPGGKPRSTERSERKKNFEKLVELTRTIGGRGEGEEEKPALTTKRGTTSILKTIKESFSQRQDVFYRARGGYSSLPPFSLLSFFFSTLFFSLFFFY